MKRFFDTLPWLVILLNLPVIYYTILIVVTDGGVWGFGWFIFPFVFVSSLFVIPAVMHIKRRDHKNIKNLNVWNIIGLLVVLVIVFRAIEGFFG